MTSDRPLAFGDNHLDRSADRRGDAGWLAQSLAAAETQFVHINSDRTIVVDGRLHTGRNPQAREHYLLGIDAGGRAWFACRSDAAENLRDLRGLAVEGLLPAHELALLAQARSIVHWHERHGFCANCGQPTEVKDAGYRRHCPACSADHFPRTDPVVIMTARNGDSILLGRQSSWQPGVYSTLAGFMEPGETIEEAARREVLEESGIRTHAYRYVASQPWPFPSSLMIGLIGEALDRDIRIDSRELEDARWFGRSEVDDMLNGTHENGLRAPPPMAIAHRLMRLAFQSS
ncbi:MAG: NAD(+) diphosphatase [Hyphomicrobiales bacterium]